MLTALRLSFLALSWVCAALLGPAASAEAESLSPGKTLEQAREEVAEAFDFSERASAGSILSRNAYLLLFNQAVSDEQIQRLNRNYRLLLALTLDEDTRGYAALFAAATAFNAGRDDHAQALALEAISRLSATSAGQAGGDAGSDTGSETGTGAQPAPRTQAEQALATAIIEMAAGRLPRRFTGAQQDLLWSLPSKVGVFGPYRSRADQDGDFARLCATFSRPIEAANRVDYRDLVSLSPRPPVERFVVLDGGRELCLVGADFEARYTLSIREGLKARDGTRLRESVQFTLTTPGRDPELRLPGQGYVLPASGAQLVPVESVNQERLRVGLYHLDERNIAQVLRGGILAQSTDEITDARDLYDYIEERTGTFRDRVSLVFEGLVSVDRLKHQRRRDGLPLAEMIDGPIKRGLYLLTLQGDQDGPVSAPQENGDAGGWNDGDSWNDSDSWNDWDDSDVTALKWIMISDLALTTVDSPQGLFINAVDSRTGTPIFEDVTVELVTRGNRVMQPQPLAAEAAATAFFSAAQLKGQNADAPLYLYASHPDLGDAFLALGRAPIEIDSPLDGLPALKSGALDLWAKTDRGLYREGETARIVGLLRQTRPSEDVLRPESLLARVLDPQGEVVETFDIDLSAAQGFETEVALPFGARQGRWSLNLSLGQGLPTLQSVAIPVADFVPPSVEIKLAEPSPLRLDGSDTITVQVDYLFGAPAKNLSVSLRGRLIAQPQLAGFNVGLTEEDFVFAQPFDLFGRTDAAGSLTFDLPVYALPDQTAASLIAIDASVTDAAGREEQVSATLPLVSDATFIGLKPNFDPDQPVAEASSPTFSAAALRADGSLTATTAKWVLYRELYDYNWYFDGGRWNYESSYIDLPVAEGTLALDPTGESQLRVDVDWGAYRLELVDQNGRGATSLRFNAGWRALPQVDRAPGRLGITLVDAAQTAAAPRPGDSIDLLIDSPFDGTGLIYLVGSETHARRLGSLNAGSNRLSLTLPETWDDAEGLWLFPVVYSAGATGLDELPSRAVGAHFVSFDQRPLTLDLSPEVEDEIKPRDTLNVPVSIGNLAAGERAFALGWIVDDGVLAMTGYRAPDPLGYFLDPYALPADLRDTFAAMIASAGLEAAALKQGYGDEFAMSAARAMMVSADFSLAQGITTRIKETLALSSHIVELDQSGDGQLSFEVPDFVGRGRLMTLAWTSKGRLGQASQSLQIRDTVVADLFLPRFLAPGDEIDVRLLLSNTQDQALNADLRLSLEGGLALSEGAARLIAELDAKGQQSIPLRLRAGDNPGVAAVTLDLSIQPPGSPDAPAESLQRRFEIEVRAVAPREVVRDSVILETGESFRLDPAKLAALQHSAIQMTVAPANSIDAGFLAQALSTYPYGCTEQTTSRALGLLLGAGELEGVAEDWISSELQAALVTLQNRRGSGGLVGLWSGYGEGDLFLHAYATDFLALAEQAGIEAAAALRPAFLDRLKRGLKQADDPYYDRPVTLRTRAYGLAVLAQAGRADIAAQRLLFDKLIDTEGQDFAKAALAVAAHSVGDRADRDALLDSLLTLPAVTEANEIENYGNGFRDQLAALALLAEAELQALDAGEAYMADALPRVAARMDHLYLTTQEQAWALRLSQHLGSQQGKFRRLDGETWDQPYQPRLNPEDFDGSQSITNLGEDPLLVSLWQAGTAVDTSTPVANGLSLQRLMFDLDSLRPVTNPAPGQRVLVGLFGTAFDAEPLDYVIADLLPAGFEVERTGLPTNLPITGGPVGQCPDDQSIPVPGICQSAGEKAFQLTGNEYAEARTDRVLFGFNTGRGNFAHYYVMRRTQAGLVTHPGAYIEAMYVPALRARTAASLLQ